MPFSATDMALLKGAAVLQDIPPPVVAAAIAAEPGNQFSLVPETTFLQAGQLAPGLCLIAHGTIELFTADAGGKEKILDFAGAGMTVAEETLFSDRPLQYSARSLTHAAVLHLPNALVSAWIADYPGFGRRLMALVSERIQYMYKDMLTFCTKRATARLVCYVVCRFEHAPRTPDGTYSLSLPIPRHKLASRLGISDSHLSRSFRELEEKGLIVPQGRGYFIPDVPALSLYVCPAGCDF